MIMTTLQSVVDKACLSSESLSDMLQNANNQRCLHVRCEKRWLPSEVKQVIMLRLYGQSGPAGEAALSGVLEHETGIERLLSSLNCSRRRLAVQAS